MLLSLLLIIATRPWRSVNAGLTEFSGFHCMMRHSMRMNRLVHGEPQQTEPPFEFHFQDDQGHETQYYEPGKIYTIRLIGFVHFRGLLLQARLTNENGFLLGSLKGGRFIESKKWETFGIRMQDCDQTGLSWQDSVTHADDSRKFLVQLEWTSDKDIGAVQFMLTIAEEDEIYWERWRPQSGFIMPITWKGKHINIINEVFTDEKAATKLAAKKQKYDQSRISAIYNRNITVDFESTKTITAKSDIYNSSSINVAQELGNIGFKFQDKDIQQRDMTETLRDLAYRHENEIDDYGEKQSHVVQYSMLTTKAEKARSFSTTQLPLSQKTELWQLRTGKMQQNGNIYEGRFPKISISNLNKQLNKMRIVMTSAKQIDKCIENPCQNDGRCRVDKTAKLGFICTCKRGWAGPLCQMKDHCIGNYCASGDCVNLEDSYGCVCWKDFAGKFCTRKCDPDLCKRNGTCVEKSNGELGCKCPPGSSGRYCEREINECNFRRCKNGAKCIDKWNDYECICKPGWMGKDCDRPCQDIYGSCILWKRQGQCEHMRDHTRFFDINCAVSCGQCIFANETVTTTKPLAPILFPLAWMIGIWKAEVNGTRFRTVDYVTDFEGISYTEIISITVTDVLMFGKPSINFTSIAINKNDTRDQHIHYGFLTIGSTPDGNSVVALITASNLGQIMIEEGEVRPNSIQFTPMYRSFLSQTGSKLSFEMQRTFSKNDKRLVQTLTKLDSNGRSRRISKRYEKIVDVKYL